MKYAIIIIPAPEPSNERGSPYEHWCALQSTLKSNATKAEGVVCISPNVFVFPVDNNVAFLGELIQSAKGRKIPFQMLLLDEAPAWIYSDPPKSI